MDEGENQNSDWFQFFEDDLPWDEFKWEVFMRDEDEETCRFFRKFTQSQDLPDTEEMISRELNGDYGDDDDELLPFEDGCDEFPEFEESNIEDDNEIDEVVMPADFRKDSIWKKSYKIATRLEKNSKSLNLTASGHEACFDLMLNSRLIAAKIAGAFDLGFHLEGLGGNIANHKKAFSCVLKCLDAISELEDTNLFNKKEKDRSRRIFLELREEIMTRIDELRLLFNKMREER